MHTKYTKLVLFVAGLAALTSCSTAYKMGQTPDDVYYSPAKPQSAYVSREERDGDDSYYEANPRRRSTQNNQYNSDPYYSGYDMYRNDRFLRMSIGNRYRWNGYNDYLMYDGFYNYNRFSVFNDFYFSSPWNSFSYWNSFYNPYTSFGYGYQPYSYYGYGYGTPVIIGGGSKYPATNVQPTARPRAFNPAGYTNSFSNNNRYLNSNAYTSPSSNTNRSRYNNSNMRYNNSNSNSYYNNSNNSNNRVNTYRSESNNSFFNNNSSSNNSSRAYTPSSSSGSSSSGSSGGGSSSGGGVSRPTRGGN